MAPREPREKVLTEVEAAVLRDRILESGVTPKQAERAMAALANRHAARRLKDELLSLMEVQGNGDWGPNPFRCRWCGCWLAYGDSSEGRPEERHQQDCFAVEHLGRPARAEPPPESTPPRAHTIRRRCRPG